MAAQSHPPVVVLDRDGTLNVDDKAIIASADDWVPVPGALEAVARLNQAGWRVVVATNQSGLGRGLFDVATMNAVHTKMHKMLAAVGGRVDAVFFCPHTRDDACDCRKPQPGLMHAISDGSKFPYRRWLWRAIPCGIFRPVKPLARQDTCCWLVSVRVIARKIHRPMCLWARNYTPVWTPLLTRYLRKQIPRVKPKPRFINRLHHNKPEAHLEKSAHTP